MAAQHAAPPPVAAAAPPCCTPASPTFLAALGLLHGCVQDLRRQQAGGQARHQRSDRIRGGPLGPHSLHHILAGCTGRARQAGRDAIHQSVVVQRGTAAPPAQSQHWAESLPTAAAARVAPATASLKVQPKAASVARLLKMLLSFCSIRRCMPADREEGRRAGRQGGGAQMRGEGMHPLRASGTAEQRPSSGTASFQPALDTRQHSTRTFFRLADILEHRGHGVQALLHEALGVGHRGSSRRRRRSSRSALLAAAGHAATAPPHGARRPRQAGGALLLDRRPQADELLHLQLQAGLALQDLGQHGPPLLACTHDEEAQQPCAVHCHCPACLCCTTAVIPNRATPPLLPSLDTHA